MALCGKIEILNTSLSKISLNQYDYVIVDLGILLNIGKICGSTTIISSRDEVELIEHKIGIEMNYCQKIICVASATPWKIYKSKFLINNIANEEETADWIFLFNGDYKNSEFQNEDFNLQREVVLSYENDNFLDEIVMKIND